MSWLRRAALSLSLLSLSACPRPRPWVPHESTCAWSTGKVPESLDLDTAAYVRLTHDVAKRKAAIDEKWSTSARRFTDALGFKEHDLDKVAPRLRADLDLLKGNKCVLRYERSMVCLGEPDDAMRRETRLDVRFVADCPELPPDTRKIASNVNWLGGEPLHDVVESGVRYRALLPVLEAIAARKRGIPTPPSDDERSEWDCAATQLASMIPEVKSLVTFADELERVFKSASG